MCQGECYRILEMSWDYVWRQKWRRHLLHLPRLAVPAVTPRLFTPIKPKFGGLVQVSDATTTEAWVGGEPLSDWSGLKKNLYPKPNMWGQCSSGQPASMFSKKAQPYRRTGLKDKFSKGDDLLVFQWQSMEAHEGVFPSHPHPSLPHP